MHANLERVVVGGGGCGESGRLVRQTLTPHRLGHCRGGESRNRTWQRRWRSERLRRRQRLSFLLVIIFRVVIVHSLVMIDLLVIGRK